MSKLLVIGGTGFFGKSILDSYLRRQLEPWKISEIFILSRSASNLKLTHPHLLNESIRLIDADITTCKTLPFADYVIHAAASSDASQYLLQPISERENILAAARNYRKLANQFHKQSKIVYASSGAVYGQQGKNQLELHESDRLISIDSLPEGKRNYAAAKRDSEEIFKSIGDSGIMVSIARCFAFVGPYLPRDQHFAIGNFIADGLARKDIEVKAEYPVMRSYMFADDLVRWLMTIAQNANSVCPIYNVGSSQEIELKDLGLLIANYFKIRTKVSQISDIKIDRYIPSISLAKKKLGLSIHWNLIDSVQETIKRIREHEKHF
jgi:nucleoside-diphosphate-sugar epimerase